MVIQLGNSDVLHSLRPNGRHRFPQNFGRLRAKKAFGELTIFVNNGKEGMSSPTIPLLQGHSGRSIGLQADDVDFARKLICQPIHDRLHLQSGHSTVCVKHDQGRSFRFNSGLFRLITGAGHASYHQKYDQQ
jgi:hypothetical protein